MGVPSDSARAAQAVRVPVSAGESLPAYYLRVRQCSEQFCEPLAVEDYGLQAMASTSPAKWHLAHTTWFFETFILKPFQPAYRAFHPQFEQLFNSYYNGIGRQYPRAQRHLLSRPTVDEVYRYREHVDRAMLELLESASAPDREIAQRIVLGCHHEQQHQELFFTDLKYCWFQNPLYPTYCAAPLPQPTLQEPVAWQSVEAGLYEIGHNEPGGFCFDNELPRHGHYLPAFALADRLVSNGEFLEFIDDGGYERPELWLADGWAELEQRAATGEPCEPLYWVGTAADRHEYTLHGLLPLDANHPVAHLSAYEADAYARWSGCRLPTEFEWEVGAGRGSPGAGQFLNRGLFHPVFEVDSPAAQGACGRLWQWTSSAYAPYPGFRTAEGAVGEYNGKFMANQLVLRGGSCVTDSSHYRHSYRNFFYPPDRWQFTGLRLARDL